MPLTNARFQRRLQWLAVGIIACIFSYTALDRLLFPSWRQGYIALQVRYADGHPAAGLGVRIHRVDTISYIPRGIRLNMTILGTQSDGTWRDLNSEHYGRFEVTLFSDTRFTTPIHRQQFDVWPFAWTTSMKIILDRNISMPTP
jgi:hypothetical protein